MKSLFKSAPGARAPLLIALLALVLALLPTAIRDVLVYQHHAIEHGQWWRLLSGHLLHTNWPHLGLNLAGLGLMTYLHHPYYRMWAFLAYGSLYALLLGASLWWLSPDLSWYVGLSGLLHGLILYGAWQDIRHGIMQGYVLLVVVVAKVLYEQWQGPSAEVAQLIDARVAIDAHFYGAMVMLCGIGIYCLAQQVYRRMNPAG